MSFSGLGFPYDLTRDEVKIDLLFWLNEKCDKSVRERALFSRQSAVVIWAYYSDPKDYGGLDSKRELKSVYECRLGLITFKGLVEEQKGEQA